MNLLDILHWKLFMPRSLVHCIASVGMYCILLMTEIVQQIDLNNKLNHFSFALKKIQELLLDVGT